MGLFGKSAQQKRIDQLAAENAQQAQTIKVLRESLAAAERNEEGADKTAKMYKRLYRETCEALSEIVAQETPTGNATVKRMARIARGALPLLHHDAHLDRPKPAPNGVEAQH